MIVLTQSSNPGAFSSTHYVVTQTPDRLWHWTLTGIAIVAIKGTGSAWRHEEIQLGLTLQGIGQKWVHYQQWAPFITLNSISNDGAANNAGWAVDSFQVVDPQSSHPNVTVSCNVAVRDSDGFILRLGYIVHIIGSLVDPPIIL